MIGDFVPSYIGWKGVFSVKLCCDDVVWLIREVVYVGCVRLKVL